MIFIQILFLSSITLLMVGHANAVAGELGDACLGDGTCTDTDNHVCDTVDSKCKVKADVSSTNCGSSDANCPTHSTCSTSTCDCSAGYTVSGAGLCLDEALGAACLAAGTCTDAANHVCDPVDFKCKVKADGTATTCGADDAICPTNSACSTTAGTCSCSAGFTASGGLCTIIGDTCTQDSECTAGVTNSYCEINKPCSKGTCTCKSGYSGTVCTTLTYDMTCSTTADLCGTGLECKATTKCGCSADTWNSAVSACTAKKVFGGACPTDLATDCYTTTNGACTGGVCTCAAGYVEESTGGSQSCRRPYVGETCSSTCSTFSFLESGSDTSQQTPTCTSNTCGCGTNQERSGKFGSGSCYKYCLTANTGTKVNGATCTHHNECAGYACLQCPGDAAAVCYTPEACGNGDSGIQASAALVTNLLGLFALNVLL